MEPKYLKNRKLWNIPIETLDIRYTKQWNVWFPEYFRSIGLDYSTIYGDELTVDEIENGSFLDVVGTNYFKASQLQQICKLIQYGVVKENDVFFFHDLWFPGLEMLAYIRDGLGLKFKIAGIFHAGTWNPCDFITVKGMEPWGRHIETGWLQFIDVAFVATECHKQFIVNSREVDPDKIVVSGLPIYDRIGTGPCIERKENICVFPHRLFVDKHPELFDRLAGVLKTTKEFKDWKFVKTQDEKRIKEEYYDLLRRSKIAVSFADHENWGIAMQEAVFAGCIPFVPNKRSYPELFHGLFIYENFDSLVDKFMDYIIRPNYYADRSLFDAERFRRRGGVAFENMFKVIDKL